MDRQVVISQVHRKIRECQGPPLAELGSLIRNSACWEFVGTVLRNLFRKIEAPPPVVVTELFIGEDDTANFVWAVLEIAE